MPEVDLRFHELHTAKAWGLTPGGFDTLSIHERAEMMSYEMVCATREAYVAEQSEEKGKTGDDESSKTQSSGNSMLDTMFERAGIK